MIEVVFTYHEAMRKAESNFSWNSNLQLHDYLSDGQSIFSFSHCAAAFVGIEGYEFQSWRNRFKPFALLLGVSNPNYIKIQIFIRRLFRNTGYVSLLPIFI